ncbi:periplasmic protein TonB [Gammaproteobacteria bacterium]
MWWQSLSEILHQKWVPWFASLSLHGALWVAWSVVPVQENVPTPPESLPWVVGLYSLSLPSEAQTTLPAESVAPVRGEVASPVPPETPEKMDAVPEVVIPPPKVLPPEPLPLKPELRVPQETLRSPKTSTLKPVAKKPNPSLRKTEKARKTSSAGKGKTISKKFVSASQGANSSSSGNQALSENQIASIPNSGEENQRSQLTEEQQEEEESTPISYRNNPRPAYPLIAKRLGQEGVSRFLVTVGTDGTPTVIHLKSSSGYPALDSAARETIAHWRFEPARRGSRAYESTAEVPIRFKIME